MSTILELREKRAKAWDAAKAFLDSKRGGNGLLSAEDTEAYERMESEVVALGKEVERLERQTSIDLELAKAVNSPITNKPTTGHGEEKTGRASAEYKNAFWNTMRGKLTAGIQNALRISDDPEGGYLVPDEFERRLIEALEEENVIRRLAHTIYTSHGDRKIPVVASKGTASWVDEGAQIPTSDDRFGQITLGAYKVATMIKVSEELLSDSAFDLETYIARGFGGRIGDKEEDAFISGDGNGKPTGFLHDTAGGEVNITTAGATAITLDEMLDLYHSLKSPYRRKAVFIMNDSTVKIIRKLKDANGQFLWQPSVKEGTPDTLLGKRILTSPYMPAVAAGAKSVAFGDFQYYWIADRQGRVFKRLNDLFAQTGQVGFLATQRVDGKVILPEAIQIMQQRA